MCLCRRLLGLVRGSHEGRFGCSAVVSSFSSGSSRRCGWTGSGGGFAQEGWTWGTERATAAGSSWLNGDTQELVVRGVSVLRANIPGLHNAPTVNRPDYVLIRSEGPSEPVSLSPPGVHDPSDRCSGKPVEQRGAHCQEFTFEVPAVSAVVRSETVLTWLPPVEDAGGVPYDPCHYWCVDTKRAFSPPLEVEFEDSACFLDGAHAAFDSSVGA